jgi:hypothetical protein
VLGLRSRWQPLPFAGPWILGSFSTQPRRSISQCAPCGQKGSIDPRTLGLQHSASGRDVGTGCSRTPFPLCPRGLSNSSLKLVAVTRTCCSCVLRVSDAGTPTKRRAWQACWPDPSLFPCGCEARAGKGARSGAASKKLVTSTHDRLRRGSMSLIAALDAAKMLLTRFLRKTICRRLCLPVNRFRITPYGNRAPWSSHSWSWLGRIALTARTCPPQPRAERKCSLPQRPEDLSCKSKPMSLTVPRRNDSGEGRRS